ncbi:hypothetical protein KM043_016454 [Ampulex compressa]|nr:hypothetical protein KM043_016454 [Ampulex compressa]
METFAGKPTGIAFLLLCRRQEAPINYTPPPGILIPESESGERESLAIEAKSRLSDEARAIYQSQCSDKSYPPEWICAITNNVSECRREQETGYVEQSIPMEYGGDRCFP